MSIKINKKDRAWFRGRGLFSLAKGGLKEELYRRVINPFLP
jgi:hypothetical protein